MTNETLSVFCDCCWFLCDSVVNPNEALTYNKKEIGGSTFSLHAEVKKGIWNWIKSLMAPLLLDYRIHTNMAATVIPGLIDDCTVEESYRKIKKPRIGNDYNKYAIIKNGHKHTGPLTFEFVEESEFIDLYNSLENQGLFF